MKRREGEREREYTMSLALERDGIRRRERVRDEGEKGGGHVEAARAK